MVMVVFVLSIKKRCIEEEGDSFERYIYTWYPLRTRLVRLHDAGI